MVVPVPRELDLHLTARVVRERLGANESVITADGVWLGRSWLRVSRDPDEHAGVLAREQEIKTLDEELASRVFSSLDFIGPRVSELLGTSSS